MPNVRSLNHPLELRFAEIITEIEKLGEDPVLDKALWVLGIGKMKLFEYFEAHPELVRTSTG
jgi:hypothetical protein